MSGITTGIDPASSTLSPNFAPYVYNMLGKGEAAANLPFQEFTGQRFAGPSALQQQAFSGIAGLGTPSQFGTATGFLTNAGQQAAGLGYTPTSFGNFFQAPGAYQPSTFASNFQMPGAYQPSDLVSGVNPISYQSAGITTGLGPVGSVQSYMNPYASAVTDPTVREMERQADIATTQRNAKFTQAGAFGGARQAIENAEADRNLRTRIGDVQYKGLQDAYDRALGQRTQESQLGLTAQQLTEQGRQFGATLGKQGIDQLLDARKAQESARQFGATQGLTAAQLAAQFGLDAQKAGESSRQFGATQGLTAAQLAAQYGLAGAQAGESSRQFGAGFGLDALRQQLAAGQALSGLGSTQANTQLQGLQALLGAGSVQQQLNQQPLDFGYQQFQESMKYPYQQATFMQSLLQGLPLQARGYDEGQSGMTAALQGGLSGLALYNLLNPTKGP